MPKRILIFSLAYFPKHIGGAEVAIKEITDRISPAEYEFFMVTNRYDSTLPRYEKIGNVEVHRIGLAMREPLMADLREFPLHLNKLLFQLLAAWTALRLHRKYRMDACWAMMAHSCGIPAALFKTMTGVPYLLTLQEGDPPEYIERKMRLLWPLFVRAFTKADRVQAISTFLGVWARRRGFRGPLEVVPNAVDTKHFSAPIADVALSDTKKELGKKDGDIFLVTTSRLVHKNAVDDVLRALPLLPPHIHFVIFGVGPDEVKLRALVREQGVDSRVHFRGQIGHADMPRYLKACDIFIRPSRSEGMGNSFIEAFAAELPVIATQEGGIADFLFDAKRNMDREPTGWAVGKDSPGEIARAVEDILAHSEQTKKTVARAKKLACEKYDWNIIARSMKERVFDPLFEK